MICYGFLLILTGLLLALVMVLQLLAPSFLLCFISYAAMTGGLILGFIGVAKKWRGRE